MPNPSERVNLAECATHGRPPDFSNASPIVKRMRGAPPKYWTPIIALLAVAAVAAVGYFVYVVFFSPMTLT